MSADIFENINPRDKRTEGEEKLLNVLKIALDLMDGQYLNNLT